MVVETPKENELSSENRDASEEQQENFSQDLFAVSVYEAAPRLKKTFLPWHRPRKQFVREKQWCEQIKILINESMPDNNVLKYLGLPGDDLLDLKYFHKEVCVPNKLELKYLGFNNSAEAKSAQNAELNISKDELNKMPHIHPGSDIIPDDICQVANIRSLAWKHSLAMAPFDVINIDLCDGFAKDPPSKFLNTHYQAMSQLLTLQAKQKKPWLFFLTTRTSAENIEAEVFNRLKSLYDKNLKECRPFLDKSKEHFSIIDEKSLSEAVENEKGISNVFLVPLCKWIAGMLLGQVPASKLHLKSVIGYKVAPNAEHPDLFSIVLKVEPNFTPPEDKLGLTIPRETVLKECETASQIIHRVFKQIDADVVLDGNLELKNEMTEMTIQLLHEARYDITGYKSWLQGI